MRIGQIINGYTVTGVGGKDFSTKGSGLSMWTFVRKDGIEYFMKEFLYPTYPLESSSGTAKLKAKKRKDCEKFEQHHKELILKVIKSVSVGSNLVFTRDFFRHNTKYYKVTEKIDVSLLSPNNIFELPLSKKLLILKTISHSLDILHKLSIVHGDLKPNNILIKNTDEGLFTSKLIDFDNSYFEGKPPSIRDEVVGDPVYYSPELEDYILKEEEENGSTLSCKSDIFALGIIFCQYLTGLFPKGVSFDRYASNVVNNDTIIEIDNNSELPSELIELVNTMLLKSSEDRPKISEVFLALKKLGQKHSITHEPLSDSISSIDEHVKHYPIKKKYPEKNTVIFSPKLKMNMGYKKST